MDYLSPQCCPFSLLYLVPCLYEDLRSAVPLVGLVLARVFLQNVIQLFGWATILVQTEISTIQQSQLLDV